MSIISLTSANLNLKRELWIVFLTYLYWLHTKASKCPSLDSHSYLQQSGVVEVDIKLIICDTVYPGVWRWKDGGVKAHVLVFIRGTGVVVVSWALDANCGGGGIPRVLSRNGARGQHLHVGVRGVQRAVQQVGYVQVSLGQFQVKNRLEYKQLDFCLSTTQRLLQLIWVHLLSPIAQLICHLNACSISTKIIIAGAIWITHTHTYTGVSSTCTAVVTLLERWKRRYLIEEILNI